MVTDKREGDVLDTARSVVRIEAEEIGRETQQVMKEVTEGFASIITGKAEPEEHQDEEADDKEASQE